MYTGKNFEGTQTIIENHSSIQKLRFWNVPRTFFKKNDLFPGQNKDMPRISKKSDQLLHSVAEMKHLDFRIPKGIHSN